MCRYLWLDMDSRWGTTSAAKCDPTNYERCQAYIMIELLPPTGNTPIPGYEKEKCNIRTMHESEQGMPLTWKPDNRDASVAGPPPPPLAGKQVRARIYLRDATVYAIGGGNSWH